MPIETPRGVPFSVDTWGDASKRKKHHFLTHAHKDHLSGIAAFSYFPIYCSRLTKTLVRRLFPQLEDSLFLEIEVGDSLVVRDSDGDFSVRAFDANHCPGATMFLFEGEFGNILHTGDCRLSPECLQNLPLKHFNKNTKNCGLDYIFLDCTFGRFPIEIPSKKLAIQQVINCIWKHPNAPLVYLACDMLGHEDILIHVSKAFGSKIYVDQIKNSDCFNLLSIMAPEILSNDDSSRFQLIESFPLLNERASKKIVEARSNSLPEPLFIRPSTQWYATKDPPHERSPSEAEKDENGVWHVCYSMHSSRAELELALLILEPKWVISTTPPCRAMELDYVKKHCYKTRLTHDDPIWKLLYGTAGKPAAPPISPASISATSEARNNIPPITLFGRARLGGHHINVLEEKNHCSKKCTLQEVVEIHDDLNDYEQSNMELREAEKNLCSKKCILQEVVDIHDDLNDFEQSKLELLDINVIKEKNLCSKKCTLQEVVEIHDDLNVFEQSNVELHDKSDETSYVGSSKYINGGLRRLYRSMNVAVPRPLPSVVDLMNSIKRIKSGSDYSFLV